MTTIPALPDDILHLLCEELANQDQFDTLFNCACSSRVLAVPALTHLYRAHHKSPVRGGGDEAYGISELVTVQRWSILWRSIVASALDDTLFPYCRYIRSLDLRDLKNLLEDDKFSAKVSKQFFSGCLKQFENTETRTNPKGRKYTRLKFVDIIDAIGEVVTQHTPTLEVIAGELLSSALVRWIPRLPRLQGLELWNGSSLEDELVHASINQYCANFNSLSIYLWLSQDRDHKFSKFISALRPNALQQLHAMNDIGAGAEAFLALNQHGKSLEDLRLSLTNESFPHLSLLQECIAVRGLRLEGPRSAVDLEASQNEAFLETIAWLRKCHNLQRLAFTKLQPGAALATPVLLEERIKLNSLEIDSYTLKDHRTFHQALVHQQDSLRILNLSGETDEMFRDDLDILVDSLKQLHELRDLKLMLPEVLRDEHVVSIIGNLVLMEDLYISGLELNDVVLDTLANLRNLRSVTLSGISKFTMDGLLDFVSRLGPGNLGLRITIDMADPDSMLPDDTVSMIRECLVEKAGGTLEYTPYRDPDMSEFDGESD